MEPGPANLPPGLCATCVHAKVIASDRGHRFIRCGLSEADPRYARYPLLPVAVCAGHDVRQPPASARPS